MPYEYFFFLTIVFAVLFVTACFYFLWIFYERSHKKHLVFSIVFAVITGCLIWLSFWSHNKMKEQEQGVEIERIVGSESDLDTAFLNYYKRSAQGGYNYAFKMAIENTAKSYITINKVEELFSSKYIVLYHLSAFRVEHLIDEEVTDEQDMEG